SNYEVAELTWENGQLAMHELGGILPTAPTKPTWGRTGDTLESIVHQATCHKQNPKFVQHDKSLGNRSSIVASSSGKWGEISSGHVQVAPNITKKRMRPSEYSDQCGKTLGRNVQEDRLDLSACASGSATICKDNDTTMMTWASFESPQSLKTKTTDEDSACHDGSENQDEEFKTKGETIRSHSRRSRAAAIHNQSERRRRDRINQKMNALQKLVPNASKTDKASMLDEVIDYLKQLQAQVQMMSARSMPQMMMPLGMQQHLQMSLLARMGMGVGLEMGMGMLDMSNVARAAPQSLPQMIHPNAVADAAPAFVPPPLVVPSMIPRHTPSQTNPIATPNTSVPFSDPYYAFLAQSMNMDMYTKMAALYRQQINQGTQAASSLPQGNNVQGK
ncbi:hypothetical protein RJ639_014758, partial [Escallonia herrerae]